MNAITATPVKLSDGSWGAKISGVKRAHRGMTIQIRTRSGQTWTTTVTALWEQARDGVIVKTDSKDKPKTSGNRRSTGSRRKACRTGGDCSSFGSGRSCGGHDCDGF